MAISALQLMIG